MGGVVNIISNRPTDIPQGTYGSVTGGIGNQAKRSEEFDVQSRTGSSEFFLSAILKPTNRGLDAPTYTPINDAASNSDQFFRFITQLSPRSTLAFDYSNQSRSSRSRSIPIRTTRRPGRQRARNTRYATRVRTLLESNSTQISQDGNGIFQVIPWWRSTRIDYMATSLSTCSPPNRTSATARRAVTTTCISSA